jgi:hypothetical protein
MRLQWLRAKLQDVFNQHNVEVLDDLPQKGEMNNTELAVIASHGGTGVGGYFRSVSDKLSDFSPSEYAALFRGVGCAVLFVCSGGVAHQQFMTSEALGLVASLIRAEVRSVVACPWPLPLDLPVLWSGPFLKGLRSGLNVADAAAHAAFEVRKTQENPCAWGAFHVYGDGNFTIGGVGLSGSGA